MTTRAEGPTIAGERALQANVEGIVFCTSYSHNPKYRNYEVSYPKHKTH